MDHQPLTYEPGGDAVLARILMSMGIALGLLMNGPPARADGADQAASSPEASASMATATRPQRDYYGWQIVAADVASLLVGVVIPDGSQGAIVGVTGYSLGGPVIHAIHGNYGSAVTSLGLRLGLPVTGAYLGMGLYHLENEEEDFDILGYVAVGLLLGTATAVVVDWGVLGWTDAPAPSPAQPRYVLVPQVGVGENGVSLGVQGRF